MEGDIGVCMDTSHQGQAWEAGYHRWPSWRWQVFVALLFGFWVFLIFSIHLFWGRGFPWLASPFSKAFRSEIIWRNLCVLTPLSHNESTQSKPLKPRLDRRFFGWRGFCLFALPPPAVDFHSQTLSPIWPCSFNYHDSTGTIRKSFLRRAICMSL